MKIRTLFISAAAVFLSLASWNIAAAEDAPHFKRIGIGIDAGFNSTGDTRTGMDGAKLNATVRLTDKIALQASGGIYHKWYAGRIMFPTDSRFTVKGENKSYHYLSVGRGEVNKGENDYAVQLGTHIETDAKIISPYLETGIELVGWKRCFPYLSVGVSLFFF